VAPEPPIGGTPWPLVEKKGAFMGSTSNQPAADQPTDYKKGATYKDVQVDPNDTDKKLFLSMELDPK
jgi:hypothetical protein